MSDRHGSTTAVLAIALLASVALAGPGAALTADATVDDPAPGAVGDYTITLRPEPGDAVARNGLKSVTLDFGADRDYSGDLGNLSDRDVAIRVGDANGTVWAGETTLNQSGDELTVTLEETFGTVRPGDRIVVRVFGVHNTEIALRNPQSLRGFALRASATGPQGNTDGPVEARYAIDPNATAEQTPTPAPTTTSTSTAGANDSSENASANDTDGRANSTNGGADVTDRNATTPGTTAANNSAGNDTDTATETMGTTTETRSTDGTSTDAATPMENGTPTETSTTENATETATTGEDRGGSGGQATETTGPGFGVLVGLVALLAAGLLVAHRHD